MLNPQPKPEPRKRVKGRKQRHARKVVKSVRQQCVAREIWCRLFWAPFDQFGPCEGLSEWAHFAEKKRFKTRGMTPEDRHTSAGSFMLCTKHHNEYDKRAKPYLYIEPMTSRGADGPLAMRRNGITYTEKDQA